MYDLVMEWLGLADYIIPFDLKICIVVLVSLFILNFVLDIIKYILYYISER